MMSKMNPEDFFTFCFTNKSENATDKSNVNENRIDFCFLLNLIYFIPALHTAHSPLSAVLG